MQCIVWVLALAAFICHATAEFEAQTCNFDRTVTIQDGAEAMIGGIIGMNAQGSNGYGCGVPTFSMQSYEAVRYTLDLINKKNELLNGQNLTDYYVPGIRLGMRVMDSCVQEGLAVSSVSSIFPSLASDSRSCSDQRSNLTLGIIGTSSSGVTGKVAGYSNKFDIPVVSYMATAPSLTFSKMYPNFLRTIPPDSDLVKVVSQVMVELSWKYVVVVYEDNTYGRSAYNELRSVLAKAGICLTAAIMADTNDISTNTVRNILGQVVATDTVGTVFLGSPELSVALLEQGTSVNGAGKLQWIFTDSISLDTTFSGAYSRGIIAIVPASRFIVEFEDHWVRIDEENPSPENPWFREWYMEKNKCNLQGSTKYGRLCSSLYAGMTPEQKEREKRLQFVQDQFVEPAVHAVFTYAHALRKAQQDKCGPNAVGSCAQLLAMKHEEFLNSYLKNVDFTYAAYERVPSLASDQYAPYKAAKRLQFDSKGDIVNPSFSVWNYNNLPRGEETSTDYKFREVGNFINGRLSLRSTDIRMYTEDRSAPLSPLPASPCPDSGCAPCLGIPQEMKYYYQPGDIVINGIFSLHKMGGSKFTCGELLSSIHPLFLEAMIYAVKKVNTGRILRGVTLGGLGIDDCMDSDLSSNFIMQVQRGMYKVRDSSGGELDPRTVEAYSAAFNSRLTVPLAGLMDDIFMQPMVGYRASSGRLDRYKYYLKTVPGMEEEFRAIIMIMRYYNWNYTQVIHSSDAYDKDDAMRFRHLAAEAGICVVASHGFGENNTDAVKLLSHHSTVRPVVLLLSSENHRLLLKELKDAGTSNLNDFIVTTTFGSNDDVTSGFETIAEGFISIDIPYSKLTSFYNQLSTYRVNTYVDNPWFEEWFESAYECYVGDNPRGYKTPCNVNDAITNAAGFKRDLNVVHVINAVYAIARGLNTVLSKYCTSGYNKVCAEFVTASRVNKGLDLLKEIQQVSFTIEDSIPAQQFRFWRRSGAYTFNVYNYGSSKFNLVGAVTPSTHTLSLNPSSLTVWQTNPTCPKPCIECLYMFAFQKYWYLDGDLLIASVFDVHYAGTSMFNCGPLRHKNGVQYTEAFKFALDYVNGGSSGVNLNGVKLGGLAFDGCTSPARTLAIVNGVMGRSFPIIDNSGMRADVSKLVSWLTYDSESTMEAADLLKLSETPIVSPGATAPQLLNKTRYSTFFRTIPSDTVIAKAMANFINDMGWKYVITLNAPDIGSRETKDIFRQYLKEMGICVVAAYEFVTDGTIENIINSITASTTQVVAVFADPDRNIPEMLRYKETVSPDPRIVFISNRFWNLKQMGLTKVFPNTVTAIDSLSFQLTSSNVNSFVNYLKQLSLASSSNPWLPEYYQALFKCDLGGNRMYGKSCTSTSLSLGTSADLYQHMYVLTTINAVHAVAKGIKQVLIDKCGASYNGVCGRFFTDPDTLSILMTKMDVETFPDVTSVLFDFIEREAARNYKIMRHVNENSASAVATISSAGNLTYETSWNKAQYNGIRSECTDDCSVCEAFDKDLIDFSLIDGDVFIVGLFDVHNKGSTPYTCGSIRKHQGLQLLEAFNFAIDYMKKRQGLFSNRLRGVRVGGIGLDVCGSPTRAANLVANIHSGNIKLKHASGFEINPRQILAYVGPFDTPSTIRVADILNKIGILQITYGATGLKLQDPVKYPYFLRSVPADDKQARAIISYLKNFNLTNVQVISSRESIGETVKEEFLRLASLNLVCIEHEYTVGEVYSKDMASQAADVVSKIILNQQSKVVILLVDNPFPILQAASKIRQAKEDFLWVATDKWGYDIEYLKYLDEFLGNRNDKKNVIIFDIETADVPMYDKYLEDKTPQNYNTDPWFQEFYEDQYACSWAGAGGIPTCDTTRGLPRDENYVQDPYVLYVANAVFSAGIGIDETVKGICNNSTLGGGAGGLCLEFDVTGTRRDDVLTAASKVNFTDDTLQPFYFEPTGESSRGYHIYNITANTDGVLSGKYMYENVGSFNDTHYLKLDITYDIDYQAHCLPYDTCVCVNKFPKRIPSRYMLQPSPNELNLVYIGDIHQRDPTDPFACSKVNVGTDFFRMMAFFYAINRVNENIDNRLPSTLQLGGIALDTCSTPLRLDQDIFNLLSGYPLCDSDRSGQVVSPSSIVAFVPDNINSLPVSKSLISTGITSVSPSSSRADLLGLGNFLSVVPPDNLQAGVLLQLMGQLNWDYASVIYTDELNMVAAKDAFLHRSALDQTACIGQALKLSMDAGVKDAEAVLDQVSQQVGAKAVILFTLPAHTRLLLQAAKNRGQTGRFIWIGTSAWGQDNEAIVGLETEASGAIILRPYSAFVEDFRTFVKSLTFTKRHGIPNDWFDEIYQTIHRCKIVNSRNSLPFSTLCTKKEKITDDMVPYDPSVLHTVIAVYMVAQGLSEIPQCKSTTLDISACISSLQDREDAIYQAILNAQWNVLPDLLRDQSFTFSFSKAGYGNIGFDILNYHSSSAGYVYSRLGRYANILDFSPQTYQGLSLYDQGVVPSSVCIGSECRCQGPRGIYGVPSQWILRPHQTSVVVTKEGRTYQDSAGVSHYVETIPNITTRFKDMWGVAMTTLAAIGVIVSLALFIYLLVVYPVRGGTTILGYMLSFSIILLYALVFAFVAHVNEQLCGLRRFALGFCYSMAYGVLFVKLVDCWRSRKKADMLDVKYNKLGRPLGLFMVVVLLVLVQVMINAEWLILEPPNVVRIFYNQQYWPRCTPDDFYDEGLILSLCYVMVLILLTIILGFLSFNSTKNHRESRWILGMAILSVPSWVIWCAWAVLGAIKTRDAAVAVGLLINATMLLLLGPVRKLYLLNKYQALIEEEERHNQAEERANKAHDYSTIYGHQYDNAPQLHDRGSTIGSARGPARYAPSSTGHSAR